MPTARRPKPPETVRVDLPALTDAPAERLRAGDRREAERYADADLGGAALAGSTFSECSFERVALHEADLRGVHLADCRLSGIDAPLLRVPRSGWRQVSLSASRLGAVEAYEATWRALLVTDCKLGYLNARGSTWTDVTLRDCTVDELDLSGARLTRVALPGCRVATLHLDRATLHDVDLRETGLQLIEGLAGLAGAWVSDSQLTALAPLLADHLGIRVG